VQNIKRTVQTLVLWTFWACTQTSANCC